MVHEACRKAQSCRIRIKEAARKRQEGQCACVVVVASVFDHPVLSFSTDCVEAAEALAGLNRDLNCAFFNLLCSALMLLFTRPAVIRAWKETCYFWYMHQMLIV